MDKEGIVLAALSTAEENPFEPVQVQKLFFLIDRKLGQQLNKGPFFNFVPYDYGPYDVEVYNTLNSLKKNGDVEILFEKESGLRKYRLTKQGQEKGSALFVKIDQALSTYIRNLSDYVRRMSFPELVSAIYKAYPDMKVNSVFNQ